MLGSLKWFHELNGVSSVRTWSFSDGRQLVKPRSDELCRYFTWRISDSRKKKNLPQCLAHRLWEGSLDSEDIFCNEMWIQGIGLGKELPLGLSWVAAKVQSLPYPWQDIWAEYVCLCMSVLFILFNLDVFCFILVNEKLLFSRLIRFGFRAWKRWMFLGVVCLQQCTLLTVVSKSMLPEREHLENLNTIYQTAWHSLWASTIEEGLLAFWWGFETAMNEMPVLTDFPAVWLNSNQALRKKDSLRACLKGNHQESR